MRVRNNALLAVLDPEGKNPKRFVEPSPRGSARSSSSRPGVGSVIGYGAGRTGASAKLGLRQEAGKTLHEDAPDCTAFDLLHTEHGFIAFEHWYRKVLATGAGSSASSASDSFKDVGLQWTQVYCPPSLLHEYAFMELLRTFVECSDSEAFDFFDILDCEFLGMLETPQVYIAVCLVAALGSRQLCDFLYLHSSRLFKTLAKGCPETCFERVSWPKLHSCLRLLGTPGHLVFGSSNDRDIPSPLCSDGLTYDDFLKFLYPIFVQLDRGAEIGESTVINEGDRIVQVRSRSCIIS
jgi:hypothetical protein